MIPVTYNGYIATMKLATQLFIFVLGCCLSHCCFGQFTITGKVQDSATQQPLNLATISIYNAQDTTLVTYRLTSQDGHFKVTDVPLNRTLTLVITFSGYDVFRRELISTQPTTTDLGTIYLQPISKTLEEVLVAAERPPVSIRKDTIEFNAASFKTLPTSFVEDLLKKLPGVEVARDGSITANPQADNLRDYRARLKEHAREQRELGRLRSKPSRTPLEKFAQLA